MNNSTRNFTNSSNAQNSSSFKDKLRKLTTGVALAGTLMVGNPSCTSCSHEKNIDQEAKNEQVEKKVIEQTTDSVTDMDDFYKKAALEVAIAEQEGIAEELDMEIDQTDSENTSSMERQTKRRDSVTPELLKFDPELQKGILTYFDNCKKYGYEPSEHCKKLLASINK